MSAKEKVYKRLARTMGARMTKGIDPVWFDKHGETIDKLMKDSPSGSGFDSGTTIIDHGKKLMFETSYHHMNENGFYDGWTEHTITVIPDLVLDFTLSISGRNKRDIKDYVYEVFETWLNSDTED